MSRDVYVQLLSLHPRRELERKPDTNVIHHSFLLTSPHFTHSLAMNSMTTMNTTRVFGSTKGTHLEHDDGEATTNERTNEKSRPPAEKVTSRDSNLIYASSPRTARGVLAKRVKV